MTIVRFHGKDVNMGYSNVCVNDLGPGGLSFITRLELPIDSMVDFRFKIKIYDKIRILPGEVVRRRDLPKGVKEYGVRFKFSAYEESEHLAIFNKMQVSLARDLRSTCCEFCRKKEIPCIQKG